MLIATHHSRRALKCLVKCKPSSVIKGLSYFLFRIVQKKHTGMRRFTAKKEANGIFHHCWRILLLFCFFFCNVQRSEQWVKLWRIIINFKCMGVYTIFICIVIRTHAFLIIIQWKKKRRRFNDWNKKRMPKRRWEKHIKVSSSTDVNDDGGGDSRGNSERARNKNNRPLNPLYFWVTRTKSNMNIFIKNLSHFVVEKK